MNLDSDYISDLITELDLVMKQLAEFQEDDKADLIESCEVASLSELVDGVADVQYTYELAIGTRKENS